MPAWSPEGDNIAFRRCPTLVIPVECHIVTLKPDGRREQVLRQGSTPDWQAKPTGP